MTTAPSQSFQLLYFANCGMLVDYNGTRVLIDALNADSSPFDRMPGTVEQLLLNNCEPYGHIDLLLFTHPHSDHFDGEKTKEFLENHPETRLMMPRGMWGQDGFLLDDAHISEDSGRLILMNDDDPHAAPVQAGGLTVDFTRVDHITFPCPDHYCVKISGGDKDLVFTADMDFSLLPQLFHRFSLADHRRHILFFNPILLGKKQWLSEVASWNPERILIYHIPSEANDEHGYRKAALRRLDQCREMHPRPELLLEPMLPFTV